MYFWYDESVAEDQTVLLDRVKRLMSLYEQRLIPTLAQHEVHPNIPLDSRENYLYFTLPVCINFQRNSPALWASALKTYEDETTRYVFFPDQLVDAPLEQIRADLGKYRLALQPNKHMLIWTTIAQALHDFYEDDPRCIIAEAHRLLRSELGPSFRSWGFKAASNRSAIWRKQLSPGGYLFVRVYLGMHAAGWFRIELEAGPTRLISQADTGLMGIYATYLTTQDKLVLHSLANRARRESGRLKEHSKWASDDLPFTRQEHLIAYASALRQMLPRIFNEYASDHHLPLEPLPV
jgi:hypothetical protein